MTNFAFITSRHSLNARTIDRHLYRFAGRIWPETEGRIGETVPHELAVVTSHLATLNVARDPAATFRFLGLEGGYELV